MRFAAPLSAKEIFKSAEDTGLEDRLTLQKTAIQISKSINDVSPVTPKSIGAACRCPVAESALSPEEMIRLSQALAST